MNKHARPILFGAENCVFDIIVKPLQLGGVSDLGVINDNDAARKAKEIVAAITEYNERGQ